MVSFNEILSGKENILIVGLGYVGLPLAIALSQYFKVVGFDKNSERIKELKKGIDSTGEISKEQIINSKITFTDKLSANAKFKFIIVAVPTPVDKLKNPDLSFLISASQIVGSYIAKGGITVYESLVLGKRVILLNNSEYHELIFRKSGLDGWVRSLGVYNEFDVYKFLNLVREVLGSGGEAKALKINPIENLRRIEKIIFRVYESWSYEEYFCFSNHDVICTYRDGFCSKFFCRDCGREIIFEFDVPRNT